MVPVIILIVVVLIGAVALTLIGLRSPERVDNRALQDRLEEFTAKGETVDLRKLELSQPFTERVVYPIAHKLGELAIRFTPQNALNSISRKLELAGSPAKLDPTMILAMQFIAGVGFGGLVLLVLTLGPSKFGTGKTILFVGLFAALGFYFPQLWLSSKISKRQESIRKAMPDALDLLTICVEAGLGFDAAMAKVSEKWENELSMAFARVIAEVQLGKIRRDALRDMSDRIGLAEMTSFIAAVIQSEQLGVSLAKVLRIQSDQMRLKRRQIAEEKAHKVTVKMLVPMVLLIFPALMVVLMTPAAIRMMHSGLGDMFGM